MAAPARAPEVSAVRTGDVRLGARYWPGSPVGVPVLPVHGLSSNARLWDAVALPMASPDNPTGPVLAVDLRGHGTSADVPDPPDSDPTAAGGPIWPGCARSWAGRGCWW
ncbi:MAG: hypothetical protein ACR2G2_09505, partial [Pseudonocardia sp.]